MNVNNLVKAFLAQKTKHDMKNFFMGLLTPKEIEELSKRIKIIKLLKKNIPQQEIAKKLKVGVATVSRGAREIKLGRFKNI